MKNIARYVSVTALFLIPIFPLIVANPFFFPFITGKAFYFRILVEIAFASWIILAFLNVKYRPKLNMLTVGVTIFALVTLVADLLGVNPLRSLWSNFERMEGWITVLHLWMFFIVTTSLFDSSSDDKEGGKRMWHIFFNIELVVAFIVGCYGLFQLLGWAQIHQGSTRIDASLGNAAYMAVYMLMNVGIAAYMLFSSKARNVKVSKYLHWSYATLAIFFSFLVFETATRGTFLGLTGGTILALFLYAVLAKDKSKKSRLISVGFIGLIILLGVVLWLNRDAAFVQNHDVLNRLANISWSEAKGQARNYVWPMAIKGFTQRPVLGWGQENFNYIFNANYNPKMWSQEQWFDRAHGVYFDWLVASGLLGLLAYLMLYFLLLRAIWKSTLTITEKSILTGLIAGYAVHNIFVFDNLASYVLFFTLLGFAVSLKRFNASQVQEVIIGGKCEISVEKIEYIVTPVSIVVLILSLYFFNIRAIQANTRLIGALESCGSPEPDVTLFKKDISIDVTVANQEIREQFLSCAGYVIKEKQIPENVKQDFFQFALNSIKDQIAYAPKDARMYVLGASFLDNSGQFQTAQKILEQAHELSPNKQSVIFELANNYINTGKADLSLPILKQAYESDPKYDQAKLAYAVGLIILGHEDQAKILFKDNLSALQTPQIAQIYTQLKEYDKAIAIYDKLITQDPSNVQLRVLLAQVQYVAGMKWQAIETLRTVEKDHPEYKNQIEAAIKSVK